MTDQQAELNVQDLLSTTSLSLRSLAGESGLDRGVLWAHSCEMSDPTEWLGPHELLLTVGLCVPRSPGEQVSFVRSLHEAHLAGLILGDHETCPAISAEMLAEANRLGFPVLLADAQTPWVAIARHVAAANTSSQTIQILKLSKLYQTAANADDDYEALVRQLSKLLGVGMAIFDQQTGLAVLEADHSNVAHDEPIRRTYSLPGIHAAELQLLESPGESVGSFILVHLLKVLALNVDRLLGVVTHRAEKSERSLHQLFAGKECPEAVALLEEYGEHGSYRVASFSTEVGAQIMRRAILLRLPAFIGRGSLNHHAFIPTEVIPQFRELTETAGACVGISSSFVDLRDVKVAAEEANHVLSAARFDDCLWMEFEGAAISVLTRSQREAHHIIEGVLGSLTQQSEPTTKLRETLFTYLRNDRHWQQTANELGVHRQTLSYRLRRIEEETGKSLNRSADLSAFWIAYQAWESFGGQ